jgi:hypothetical protein
MYWRVIVRFSLNSDTSSSLRNQVTSLLEQFGVQKHGEKTSTWESESMLPTDCSLCIAEVLSAIALKTEDPQWSVILDHVWIYIDASSVEA